MGVKIPPPGDNVRTNETIQMRPSGPAQGPARDEDSGNGSWFSITVTIPVISLCPLLPTVRKQEIIKVTEQLIEAISNGDFESYT